MAVGELASHEHISKIYNVNNKNYIMSNSAIRLKDTAAYQWVDISTASDKTTAGGIGGDPCGITSATGSNVKHPQVPTYFSAYFYRRTK